MKPIRAVTSAALVAALLAGPASAADLVLKFGHAGPPGSLYQISADEFARRAGAALTGRAEMRVIDGGGLGHERKLLRALALGQADLALASSAMCLSAEEFCVFELPFLIEDRNHMKAVADALLDSVFQPAARRAGYRVLAVWELGFSHVVNDVRPIRAPEDLRGLRLRAPGGEWRRKAFRAYGASPTLLTGAELFTALALGVIDGADASLALIAAADFQQVQRYLSLTGHVYTPAYLVASEAHFSALPADVRKTLIRVADETRAYVYAEAARIEGDLLARLSAAMEVNEVDRAAFAAASEPVYREFAAGVGGGGELVRSIRSIASSK